MIAQAFVFVAALLPLAGTTIHIDAGHNGANGLNPSPVPKAFVELGNMRNPGDARLPLREEGPLLRLPTVPAPARRRMP